MTILTEPAKPGEYVRWEVGITISRNQETLASGQSLGAGAVLGRITASGKVTQLNPGASDGSEAAIGILYYPVNATASDQRCVVSVRQCEVWAGALSWPDGITDNEKTAATAQLTALGVVVRTR